MAEIKIDLKKYEGQEIKIKIQNGVAIIEGEEKVKYPEKGYWVDVDAAIEEIDGDNTKMWDHENHRNIYPNVNHAILFGQVLAPLLVKHYVLTGGYWENDCEYAVYWCQTDRKWDVSKYESYQLAPLKFPFPSRELAEQFIEENKEQLNKITELWHQK